MPFLVARQAMGVIHTMNFPNNQKVISVRNIASLCIEVNNAVSRDMEETLGRKYASIMAKFITVKEGEKIQAADFYFLSAGTDMKWAECAKIGMLHEKLFERWIGEFVLNRLRKGEVAYDMPCLISEEMLRRLRLWNPWIMAIHYLKTQDINIYCMFKNSPYDIILEDGDGELVKVYPVVLKSFPELDYIK